MPSGPLSPPAAEPTHEPEVVVGTTLRDLEKRLIERTLAQTGGNRSRTAELLGISLRTVRNKVREYGLPPRGAYAND
jgi:DNA-binding NtrC family response regulator